MNESISKKQLSKLPWNFEAFRSFINYEVLQQAASVLCLFEGKSIFKDPHLLFQFEKKLEKRTGLNWLPERNISQDILFNVEGNLFRNKARVFTSFFLVPPHCIKGKNPLEITQFCKALGKGAVTKNQFYEFIISRYKYPHPAYDENWIKWRAEKIVFYPLKFIISILLELHDHSPSSSFLTIPEFAYFGHPFPYETETRIISKNILNQRKDPQDLSRTRSDKIDRKIGDIFGFLCLSGITFYEGSKIYLNLMDVHPKEMAYFGEKRKGENRKDEIRKIVNNV